MISGIVARGKHEGGFRAQRRAWSDLEERARPEPGTEASLVFYRGLEEFMLRTGKWKEDEGLCRYALEDMDSKGNLLVLHDEEGLFGFIGWLRCNETGLILAQNGILPRVDGPYHLAFYFACREGIANIRKLANRWLESTGHSELLSWRRGRLMVLKGRDSCHRKS